MPKTFNRLRYKIADSGHWALYLHENQSYLGRAICVLKHRAQNSAELTIKEWLELKQMIAAYQAALTKLWQPDWWNYAQLGNEVYRLHFHFVPRYKTSRRFKNILFKDTRWGKNYAPAPAKSEDPLLNYAIAAIIKKTIIKLLNKSISKKGRE